MRALDPPFPDPLDSASDPSRPADKPADDAARAALPLLNTGTGAPPAREWNPRGWTAALLPAAPPAAPPTRTAPARAFSCVALAFFSTFFSAFRSSFRPFRSLSFRRSLRARRSPSRRPCSRSKLASGPSPSR